MADSTNTDSCEVWKPVPGWEGLYEVSSEGRVRSLPRTVTMSNGACRAIKGGILSLRRSTGGYLAVQFGRNRNFRVHRLVCEAFHGDADEGQDAAHNDGTRTNNRASNLRWASRSENLADRHEHGTMNNGERHYLAKLTEAQVLEIRRLSTEGLSRAVVGKMFGIGRANVRAIVGRRSWKHI